MPSSFSQTHVREAMETLLPYFTRDFHEANHLRNKIAIHCEILPDEKAYESGLNYVVVPPANHYSTFFTNHVVGEEVTHYLHLNTNHSLRAQVAGIRTTILPVHYLIEYVGHYGARTHMLSKGMREYPLPFLPGKHLLQAIAGMRFDERGPMDLHTLAKFTSIDQLLHHLEPQGLPSSFLDEIYGRK